MSPDHALQLLDALAAEGPHPTRLSELLRRLVAALSARGAALLIGPLGVEPAPIAAAGSLAGEAAKLPSGGAPLPGGRLVLDPPALHQAPLTKLAAALLARDQQAAAERARHRRSRSGLGALAHALNNRLTPLLCHADPAVSAQATRLRDLIDVLRHLRGQAPLRGLRRVPDYLALVREFLVSAASSPGRVELRCEPEARGRTVGPEQPELLLALLAAGQALTPDDEVAPPLRLGARLERGQLALSLAAAACPTGLAALAWAGLDARAPAGTTARLERVGAGLRLELLLTAPPRAVLLGEGPPPARLTQRLAAAGLELHLAPPCASAVEVMGSHPPWRVLLTADAAEQLDRLRRELFAANPALAMRCVVLAPDGTPREPSPPGAGTVELTDLLGGSSGSPRP